MRTFIIGIRVATTEGQLDCVLKLRRVARTVPHRAIFAADSTADMSKLVLLTRDIYE